MDIQKLLKRYRLLFKGTEHGADKIVFACELSHSQANVWDDGLAPGYGLAFTESHVIVGTYPKDSKYFNQKVFSTLEIRTELAPIHGKKPFSFIRAFSDGPEPRFSFRVNPEHVEPLWDYLRCNFPDTRLRRVSVSHDQWETERLERVQAKVLEIARDGLFGAPLRDLGEIVESEGTPYCEFPLVLAPALQELSELESSPLRMQVLERQTSEIVALLPEGEFVLVFAPTENARGNREINFASNRRFVFGASIVSGVIYASKEVALSEVSSLDLVGGSLVVTIANGSQRAAGQLSEQSFESLQASLASQKIVDSRLNQRESTVTKDGLTWIGNASRDELERMGRGDEPKVVLLTAAGLLAAWDDRLAIIKRGAFRAIVFNAEKQGAQEFFYSDIIQIQVESLGAFDMGGRAVQIVTTGHPQRDLTNFSSGNVGRYPNVLLISSNVDAEHSIAKVQELWRNYRSKTLNPGLINPVSNAAANTDLAEQLQALANLHAQGYLSDEEFIKAKSKFLS